jgi:hypothetical protein
MSLGDLIARFRFAPPRDDLPTETDASASEDALVGWAVPAGQALIVESTGNVPLVVVTWPCAGVPTIASDWVEVGRPGHPVLTAVIAGLPYASRVRVGQHTIEVLAYGQLTRALLDTLVPRLTFAAERFFTEAPYR